MIIYRYRKATSFNIKALLDENVNGSLFKTFDDFTELNFDISERTLDSFKISKEEKDKIISLLKTNIMDKYYMSCFTFNDPFLTTNMWKKYAGSGIGFCLAYDTYDLENHIKEHRFGKMAMRLVEYDSKPYMVDGLIEHILSPEIRKELEKNNIDDVVSKDNSRIGKMVMEMFVHKHSSCSSEREYRMILQDTNSAIEERNYKMLKIRPAFIVATKDILYLTNIIISNYAKQNNIPYFLVDNPCVRLENETYVEE